MSDEALSRRLPLYAYLEPLLLGRRVLEIGRSKDRSPEYLASLGATRVVSAPGELGGITDRFDVVLVPEADGLVRRADVVATWQRLVADKGKLVVVVANPDRGESPSGIGYFELHDAVAGAFPRVQMFGITPFLGMGLVEFDGAADGLRIDARLVKAGSEPPAFFAAVAGTEPVTGLGYALVQLPWSTAPWQRAGAAAGPDAQAARDLKAKLDEAAAQAESATRVSRAQGDEIDELRGRLRRAAEDRAGLDAEIAKLRRGLADADEAVMTLTRRTAEEMAVVADRMTASLRAPAPADARAVAELAAARDEADRLRVRLADTEARAAAAEQRLEEVGADGRERRAALDETLERLRITEAELGRTRRLAARLEEDAQEAAARARALDDRERAIAGRDERIARLETEKQDLVWRLAELEDSLRESIARAVRGEGGRAGEGAAPPPPTAVAGSDEDLAEARGARERALEGFHAAAAVHVGEITELKASVAEQAALVAELEDAVVAAEARATSASAEAAGLRKTAKELEEADRSRRSRLAELEGKLLRLEHERRQAAAAGSNGDAERQRAQLEAERDAILRRAAEDRVAWNREREELQARVEGAARMAAAGRNGHDADAAATVSRELETLETEIRLEGERLDALARAISPPGPAPAGVADPEAAARLENTLGNIRSRLARLRDDIEGVRRRFERLSSSEIAGFLEELGEDLAEIAR